MEDTEPEIADSILHGLLRAGTSDEIYRLVVDGMYDRLDSDGTAIAIDEGNGLQIVATAGNPRYQNALFEKSSIASLQQGIHQSGQVCLMDDLTDTRSAATTTSAPEHPIRSFLGVPLAEHGVVFAVEAAPNAFSEMDKMWLTHLSEYVIPALDRFDEDSLPTPERERIDVDEPDQQQIEYALNVTNSYIWAIDLETDEVRTLFGPIERLFGVSAGEIGDIDSLFDYTTHPDERSKGKQLYDRLRADEIEHFQIDHRTPPECDGVRWLNNRGYIQTDSMTRQLVGLTTDVTGQRGRQEQLQRQNERLEEFTSVVSHDLRNPLNVANGRLELAREQCDSDDLEHVSQALARMRSLIEDLLTLAREGEPITDFADVDLGDTLTRCWRNVCTKDATLDIKTSRHLRADRSRLKQLLENLFRNAIEHGGDDVTVTVGDLDDGFYVEDDGLGIPPEKREEVFESGYSTSTDGTGFGLSIVQEIANAHEWDIVVTEARSGGARFEVSGIRFAD